MNTLVFITALIAITNCEEFTEITAGNSTLQIKGEFKSMMHDANTEVIISVKTPDPDQVLVQTIFCPSNGADQNVNDYVARGNLVNLAREWTLKLKPNAANLDALSEGVGLPCKILLSGGRAAKFMLYYPVDPSVVVTRVYKNPYMDAIAESVYKKGWTDQLIVVYSVVAGVGSVVVILIVGAMNLCRDYT